MLQKLKFPLDFFFFIPSKFLQCCTSLDNCTYLELDSVLVTSPALDWSVQSVQPVQEWTG